MRHACGPLSVSIHPRLRHPGYYVYSPVARVKIVRRDNGSAATKYLASIGRREFAHGLTLGILVGRVSLSRGAKPNPGVHGRAHTSDAVDG